MKERFRTSPGIFRGRNAPGFRAAMALVLLWTSSASAVDSLWSDRRRGVLSRTAERDGGSLASPSVGDLLPGGGVWDRREGVPWPKSVPSGLPQWLSSTVGLYGDVAEVRLPSPSPSRFVIHIQDLHGVESAQKSVAGLLEQLTLSLPGPRAVGLEGAAGPFRLNPYRKLADSLSLRRTADALLRQQVITGSEYFGLLTESSPHLTGAEDPDLYRRNVRALRNVLDFQSEDEALVDRLSRSAAVLKSKLWTPDLTALDEKIEAYEDGRLLLGAYFNVLTEGVPEESLGPESRRFRALSALEKAWEVGQATAERARLLERLTAVLSPAESRRLGRAALDRRMGRLSQKMFHQGLTDLMTAHGLSWASVPAYAAHEQALLNAEMLDGMRLISEVKALASSRCAALAGNDGARGLVALAEDLRLLRRLSSLSLSPTGVAEVRARKEALLQIPDRLAALAASSRGAPPSASLSDLLRRRLLFYTLAEKRNAALAEGILGAMDVVPTAGPAVGLLVAGGYHAEGLREALLERNVAYIGLIPRVEGEIPKTVPLEQFRPGRSPFERYFAGGRSELQDALVLAETPLRGSGGTSRSVVGMSFLAMRIAGGVADGLPWRPQEPLAFRDLPSDLLAELHRLAESLGQVIAEEWPGTRAEVSVDLGKVTFLPEGGLRVSLPVRFVKGEEVFQRDVRVDFPSKEISDGVPSLSLAPFLAPRGGGWARGWDRWALKPARRVVGLLGLSRLSPWARGVEGLLAGQSNLNVRGLPLFSRLTWGAASFGLTQVSRLGGWLRSDRLSRWALRWNSVLLQDEEARWLRLLQRAYPAGVPNGFLISLAQMHRAPLEQLRSEGVMEALKQVGFGSALSVESSRLESPGPGFSGRLSLALSLDGRLWTVTLQASDAPALYLGSVAHRLIQGTIDRENQRMDLYLQEPVFSNANVLRLSLKHFLKELRWMEGNPNQSPSLAHGASRDLFEERLLDYHLKVWSLSRGVQTFDNKLLSGTWIPDLRWSDATGQPGVVLLDMSDAVSSGHLNELNALGISGYVIPPFSGSGAEEVAGVEERLRSLGVAEPAVWARAWISLHLERKSEVFDRLARYLEARDRTAGGFPWPWRVSDKQERLADLVTGLVSSVGGEAGQKAALAAGAVTPSEGAAFLQRAPERELRAGFAPLARTVLALLDTEGVVPLATTPPARLDSLAEDFWFLYRAAFREGTRRMAVWTTENVVSTSESKGARAGVFLLQGPVSTSPAAREILRVTLAHRAQGTLDQFFPAVFLETSPAGAQAKPYVLAELQHLLEKEFPGLSTETRSEMAAAWRSRLVVAPAGGVRVGNRLSVDKILQWARLQWKDRSLEEVALFAQDREALLLDARNALGNWVVYLIEPRGLLRLTGSSGALESETRVRRALAVQA